jgi:hypothetical protein
MQNNIDRCRPKCDLCHIVLEKEWSLFKKNYCPIVGPVGPKSRENSLSYRTV